MSNVFGVPGAEVPGTAGGVATIPTIPQPLPAGTTLHHAATTPSEAMQWLLGVAAQINMNPMELAHMIMSAPEKVAGIFDGLGIPSPAPAEAETALDFGLPTTLPEDSMVSPGIDYAVDPTVEGGATPIPAGTVAPESMTSEEVAATPAPVPPVPGVQVPGPAPAQNVPQSQGTPMAKVLSGLTMPPSPNVQGIGAPSPPRPDQLAAPDLNALINSVLSVAKPSTHNLTLQQALPQGRR